MFYNIIYVLMWHNVQHDGISRRGRKIAGKNSPDGREIDLAAGLNTAEKCCKKKKKKAIVVMCMRQYHI